MLRECVRAEAEPVHRAGFQVLHEDVRAGDEGHEFSAVAFLGKVQRHGLLSAIEPDEIAAQPLSRVVLAAREIAFGALDLDDGRARIRESRCAERSRDGLFDRNDEDALQRWHQ